MVQVLTETPFRNGLLQIRIGGGDKADVKGPFPDCPDRQVTLFLQGAKQFHLIYGSKVTDFIKEQRTTFGSLEKSRLVTVRTGERPFAVPEEFGSDKVIGNGTAVHSYKRLVPAQAPLMNLGGNMFLTRTRCSTKQDGHVRTGHRAYQPVHLTGLFTFTTVEFRTAMLRTAELFFYDFPKPVRMYRLAKVIGSPKLHGFHRILHLAVTGHNKERDGIMFSLHPLQQLHTAAVRQTQVCQDKVELLSLKFLTGCRECNHISGCHTLFLQPVTDTATEDNIILYNQYIFHLLILYSSSYFQHRQLVSRQLFLLYRYTLSVLPSRVPVQTVQ